MRNGHLSSRRGIDSCVGQFVGSLIHRLACKNEFGQALVAGHLHVVATGGGSGLIRTPARAIEIIRSTKMAGLPTSVKTRLGYTYVDEWRDWLATILRETPDALTVHLRTKKEMSKVEAHYELIPEILALKNEISPATKLIINGDFDRPSDAQKYFDMGVDGVMIGRGVFRNPFCRRRGSPWTKS